MNGPDREPSSAQLGDVRVDDPAVARPDVDAADLARKRQPLELRVDVGIARARRGRGLTRPVPGPHSRGRSPRRCGRPIRWRSRRSSSATLFETTTAIPTMTRIAGATTTKRMPGRPRKRATGPRTARRGRRDAMVLRGNVRTTPRPGHDQVVLAPHERAMLIRGDGKPQKAAMGEGQVPGSFHDDPPG